MGFVLKQFDIIAKAAYAFLLLGIAGIFFAVFAPMFVGGSIRSAVMTLLPTLGLICFILAGLLFTILTVAGIAEISGSASKSGKALPVLVLAVLWIFGFSFVGVAVYLSSFRKQFVT